MGLFDGATDGKGQQPILPRARSFRGSRRRCLAYVAIGGGAGDRFAGFRADVRIAGVILNKVGGERHEMMLRKALDAVRMPIVARCPPRQ